MIEDIILIGGGGHCKSVIDTIKSSGNFNIVGILDLREKLDMDINGVKIIGTDEMLKYYFNNGVKNAHISLGSIGDSKHRIKLFNYAKSIGLNFPPIIDRTSVMGSNVEIEEGVFIGKGCIINVDTKIGSHSIINSGAIIDHDCIIGSFCHISPGTTISGEVSIGDNTHIGTNSTIIQNIDIGSNTLIGAGSVVIKDISSNIKAYGNPCKEVKK